MLGQDDSDPLGSDFDPNQFDPNNLAISPERLLGSLRSPEQEALRPRIDAAVAALEGWSGWVTDTVAERLMPGSSRVAEALRRRRVSVDPASRFVERLFGLELTQDVMDRGRVFVRGVLERADDRRAGRPTRRHRRPELGAGRPRPDSLVDLVVADPALPGPSGEQRSCSRRVWTQGVGLVGIPLERRSVSRRSCSSLVALAERSASPGPRVGWKRNDPGGHRRRCGLGGDQSLAAPGSPSYSSFTATVIALPERWQRTLTVSPSR